MIVHCLRNCDNLLLNFSKNSSPFIPSKSKLRWNGENEEVSGKYEVISGSERWDRGS